MHKSSEHGNSHVWTEDAPTVISCAHFEDKRSLWTSSPQTLLYSAAQCQDGKGAKKMKIRILYDNKPTYLEVPDEDCSVMIDADYEDRITSAEDKETVTRRSVQEIMEEHFNKPEYNNWHKFDRHYGIPKKPFHKNDEAEDDTDHMDYFPDKSYEAAIQRKEESEYIRDIIRNTLKEKQAELLIAIVLDGVSVTEYAEREGVSVSAISHRMETAIKNLKKVFPKSSTFPSSQG